MKKVLLDNLILSVRTRYYYPFIESEVSLACLQESTAGLCPEPV